MDFEVHMLTNGDFLVTLFYEREGLLVQECPVRVPEGSVLWLDLRQLHHAVNQGIAEPGRQLGNAAN